MEGGEGGRVECGCAQARRRCGERWKAGRGVRGGAERPCAHSWERMAARATAADLLAALGAV